MSSMGRGRGKKREKNDSLPNVGQHSSKKQGAVQPHGRGHKGDSLKGNEPAISGQAAAKFQERASKDEGRGAKVDSKVESLMETMHVSLPPKYAPCPGFGTAGCPINLQVNYFDIKCDLSKIYHYDVDINASDKINSSNKKSKSEDDRSRLKHQQAATVGRKKCQEVFAQLLKDNKFDSYKPIYDGTKNLFTGIPLPIQIKVTFPVTVEMDGRKKKFVVNIQPVKKVNGSNFIDLKCLKNHQTLNLSDVTSEMMLALNAIMNYRDPKSTEVRVGRSFFSISQTEKIDIGDGLEIWKGYNQNVHLTQRGPTVVLNLSAKVFHKAGPIIDYVNDVLGHNRKIEKEHRPLTTFDIKKIEDSLKNVRIYVTHLPYRRKYHIKSISKLPARDHVISIDNQRMSVADYFRRKYGELQYPHLHSLHMRTSNDKTYVPLEKCVVIEGQPKLLDRNNVLPNHIASKMIKETAVPPSERFNEIKKYASIATKESGQQMRNFNMFMSLEFKKLQGRVINPPTLEYSNSVSVPNASGTWSMKGQFLKPFKINSWVVLSFTHIPFKILKSFASQLEHVARSYGLVLGELQGILFSDRHDSTSKCFQRKEMKMASLAVIVLSKKDSIHCYDEIKFIADYQLGLVNQCILDTVVQRFDDQIARNICLKINAKLGGVNHKLKNLLKIFANPVIVFGADVVHSNKYGSIASVVGSLDSYPSKYQVTCRFQENKNHGKKSQELIRDLEKMVKTILQKFYIQTKGKYPERIIFFRDGVSEGQFSSVLHEEVVSIEKAARDVIGHVPPITFVVVQKRHQTRLRPQDPRDGLRWSGNVPPGTTVDREITYPNTFDYFLCSHEGIRGTSKPARYTVLYDTNNFSADDLHELTYHMCHMFVRCNKSVSIPAPVKYADLAAYRAKKYADFHYRQIRYSWDDASSSSNDSYVNLPDKCIQAINDMEICSNHMFYV